MLTAIPSQRLNGFLEITDESRPRISRGGRLAGQPLPLREAFGEQFQDQLVLVREPSVEAGDADPRARGHVRQGRLQPAFGEDLAGGVEDAL